MKLEDIYLLEGTLKKTRQCNKKQRHHFTNKCWYSQSYGFSSSHVQIWELDHKNDWVPNNWCFPIVMLEKTLLRPLDCNEIKWVNPKGNQPWVLIWRTDSEAEAPILWLPDAKSWLTGKDPDAGKDWRQRRRRQQRMRWLGSITDSMDMNLSKFWEILENKKILECCSPRGHKESDMT